jgi:hypothetical protein
MQCHDKPARIVCSKSLHKRVFADYREVKDIKTMMFLLYSSRRYKYVLHVCSGLDSTLIQPVGKLDYNTRLTYTKGN